MPFAQRAVAGGLNRAEDGHRALPRRARHALRVQRAGLAVVAARAPDAARAAVAARRGARLQIEPRPTSGTTRSTASATPSPTSPCTGRTAAARPHARAGRGRRAARPAPRPRRSPGRRCATRCAASRAQDDLLAGAHERADALVPPSEAARAYAAPSFAPGRDWLEAVVRPDAAGSMPTSSSSPARRPSAPRSTRCCTSAAASARTSRT